MLIGRRELIKIGPVLSYKHIPLKYISFDFFDLCLSGGLGIKILEMIFLCYYNPFRTTRQLRPIYTLLVIQAV